MAQQLVTTSKQFRLNLSDWWKGLILAIAIPVVKVIIDLINSGSLTFDWLALGKLALAAGLAYVLKNFFSPPVIQISGASAETIEAVKTGEESVKIGGVTVKAVNT